MPCRPSYASDEDKYDILACIVTKLEGVSELAGRKVGQVMTVNGAQVIPENGSWGLVRASSNTPNLVVVCEIADSEAELRAIFKEINDVIRTEPGVCDYD